MSVASHRSFSRAANDHGLHRSAASRRIVALERALGVDLLIRTTRRVEPTTAGRQLLEEVAPLLRRVERAVNELPEAADVPAGRLRIAAPQDVGMWLLPHVLGKLAETYPLIQPSVSLSNRQVDLEAEAFDVALRIARGRLQGAGLRARRIGTIRVRAYAAPCYVARHGTPNAFEEVHGHKVVGLSGVIPQEVEAAAAWVAAGDMILAAELAKSGVGIAFLPTFVAEAGLEAGALVPILNGEELLVAGLYLALPNVRRLPGKSVAFRDAVLGYLAEHPLK